MLLHSTAIKNYYFFALHSPPQKKLIFSLPSPLHQAPPVLPPVLLPAEPGRRRRRRAVGGAPQGGGRLQQERDGAQLRPTGQGEGRHCKEGQVRRGGDPSRNNYPENGINVIYISYVFLEFRKKNVFEG